ncbi:mitochondrial ribosomal protein L52 [Rhynchophorus ferrugineus]|uniref:Large ribosomal subunit protein mL52 n=1 Tax=Rhynchophorus ferrugineus TaxID=354439 RepID=A0A834MHS3_RHYFE|nr:hypothetical protein GWI33_001902 [Rhynchophorus ferrugineus]
MYQIQSRVLSACRKCIQKRQFSITCVNNIDQRYRKERNLAFNPNACGVLTDGADYSYLDGRLTPLTRGQRRRVLRQEETKHQIIALTKEIDFAVELHKQKKLQEEETKRNILENKLKPKGMALLKSNSKL